MMIYKFKIPANSFRPLRSDPAIAFGGCLAVVAAQDEETARARIARYAAEFGLDARWIEVATLEVIEPNAVPVVLAFVMQ